MMDVVDTVMQWIVAPVAAFVFMLHRKLQVHETDIAVLKVTLQSNKDAHDREFAEMHDSFKAVMAKLESIEQYLRK
jgi:tRNA A-37 threonylcarbamoyl transferase component Bud32